METQTITYRVKLLAKQCENLGYINYVFENLESMNNTYKYFKCVRFPNWNCNNFDIYDEGFVTVRYVREGIDTWFDGVKFIPYNYTNIIFLNFIPIKPEIKPTEIVLD